MQLILNESLAGTRMYRIRKLRSYLFINDKRGGWALSIGNRKTIAFREQWPVGGKWWQRSGYIRWTNNFYLSVGIRTQLHFDWEFFKWWGPKAK